MSQVSLRVAMSTFNRCSSRSIMLVFLGVVPSSCVWIRRRPIFQHATVNTDRKTSGVGGEGEGGASAPPKVLIVENSGKVMG